MRKKINLPEEKSFEVSEMYVFGKFDTFKGRLNKVSYKNKKYNKYGAFLCV